MDRRDFFKTLLAAPVLAPFILSSKKTRNGLELYLIAEDPQVFLPSLFGEIQKFSSSDGRKFAFLNPHPRENGLKRTLLKKGWRFVMEPASANLILSFSHLRNKALPSFALVKEGRIWDIRTRKLSSLWKEMNENHEPSFCLTVATLRNTPSDNSAGEFVSVFREGRKIETLSMKKNRTKSIRNQGGKVLARIEDGKVWVTESSCRHKICLYSPPISLAGERIICAPNHILFEIQRSASIDTVIG